MVMQVEEPRGISFSFNTFDLDNDYSFNVLLQCTEFGVQESDQALEDSPYGELIKKQNVITNLGSEVPQYENDGWMIPADPPNSATLHCEFEGSGVHDMYVFAQAMLGIGVAAFIICMIVPHLAGAIVLAIYSLLVLLGFLVSKVAHPGSPSDVNPDLPTIHTNHVDSEGNLTGADVLYIQGTWVFDPLHDGYNEIHPIKACCKIGCWNGDWINTNCNPDQGPTGYDLACTGTPGPLFFCVCGKDFRRRKPRRRKLTRRYRSISGIFTPISTDVPTISSSDSGSANYNLMRRRDTAGFGSSFKTKSQSSGVWGEGKSNRKNCYRDYSHLAGLAPVSPQPPQLVV